jgi:hypothetical protein
MLSYVRSTDAQSRANGTGPPIDPSNDPHLRATKRNHVLGRPSVL